MAAIILSNAKVTVDSRVAIIVEIADGKSRDALPTLGGHRRIERPVADPEGHPNAATLRIDDDQLDETPRRSILLNSSVARRHLQPPATNARSSPTIPELLPRLPVGLQ
jgi:hypothetical protein